VKLLTWLNQLTKDAEEEALADEEDEREENEEEEDPEVQEVQEEDLMTKRRMRLLLGFPSPNSEDL